MVYVVGEETLKLIVAPGETLVVVGKPSMSPHALGEYQSLIGVPGWEFSHTTGFDPAPQGSLAAAGAGGTARAATSARTAVCTYRRAVETFGNVGFRSLIVESPPLSPNEVH